MPFLVLIKKLTKCIHGLHIQASPNSRGGATGGFKGARVPPSGRVCPPPSGNLGIFVGSDLSVCTANVRVQSSSVAFTVQIPQRCELTGLLTKHPWMVVYFSSPQQQQQHHTHGPCKISTMLYTIINEALVPIK